MRAQARVRRAVALAALLAYAMVTNPWPAHAEPRVEVSATRVQLGQDVTVRATGLAPDQPVELKICGVADEKGVLPCAPGIAGVQVDPAGAVTETFAVREPPGDCPCSVVVESIGAPPVTTRVELVNHPTATKAVVPELVVDSAEIRGGAPFGLGGSSGLELRLRNAGVSPARATLELSWREGDGEPRPVTDPELPEIAPGATRTVTVPLDLDGFTQGTYAVQGHAVVGDLYTPVTATRSLVPWGLYATVGLVLLVGAAYRARVATAPGAGRGPGPAAGPGAGGGDGPPTGGGPRPGTTSRRPLVTRNRPTRAPAEPAPAAPAPEEAPVHVRSSEPMVGPPRLTATPIARWADALAAAGEQASATPEPAAAPGHAEAVPEQSAPTAPPSLLQETGARPAQPAEPDQQAWPAGQRGGGQGAYGIPRALEESGPLPVVAPAPLVLPQQVFAPSVLDEPSVLDRSPAGAVGAGPQPGAERDALVPAAAEPTALQGGQQGDEQIVARALASIRENASGPGRLPGPDELPVPAQRDRRAPKGGKRARR